MNTTSKIASAVAFDGSPLHTNEIKVNVRRQLLDAMDLNAARQLPNEDLYRECFRRISLLLDEQGCPLSIPEKEQILQDVMDEIFGWGPLEEFLRDDAISDIMVNGPHQIYVERKGVLEKTDAKFRDTDQLLQVIERIGARVGRRIDESSPMLDARLQDGSRVNAIIPPLSLDGPILSIRRFGTVPLTMDNLIEFETLTSEMAFFLNGCVRHKMNILVSGGTGTGKTTLLNVLSKAIPEEERVVTIEDAAELILQRRHVVRLEVRPANIEGKGEVTQRDLLRNALRMRPDRIIIGEVRGREALDMLQAMNTGHEGSMTTIHANTPRDAFRRIEMMVNTSGLTFPVVALRQQICSALNVMVHVDRLTGGERKVVSVAEVAGMENDTVLLQEIFKFHQTGVEAGRAKGYFEACGTHPQLLKRLEAEGFRTTPCFFAQRMLASGPLDRQGGAS